MVLGVTVWNGIIAPVFDVAGHIFLINSETPDIGTGRELSVHGLSGLTKVKMLCEEGVRELICGAITKPTLISAESNGIKVHSFISGNVENVLEGWKNNQLDERSFCMPGCGRGKGKGYRKGRCLGRGRRARNRKTGLK